MRQRDRRTFSDSDPHGLLFEPDDDSSFLDDPNYYDNRGDPSRPLPQVQRVSRHERRAEAGHHARRRRNRRALWIMGGLLVLVLAAATFLVVLPIYHYLVPSDYSGDGTGTVIVEVQANDTSEQIGQTLHDKGVVASVRAFTDAAKDDSRSANIQPGSYKLHSHMSAKNALALLLNPASRLNSDVVVPEGVTTLDVARRLAAAPCSNSSPKGTICGAGMSAAAVQSAFAHVSALGLPTDYTVNGRTPTSAEGFLFPATYFFPDGTSPTDALGQMISKFTDQAKTTNFTAQAKALHITPYQELIIASIAQAEAKYPADFGRVARVILNRIAAKRPLQIDATSAYGAKLKGVDPTTIVFSKFPGPYNSYTNDGLPPTPISNPGLDAMNGAAHPAAGNWLYYVNSDAQGHLFFTNSEAAFNRAVTKCRTHHWGCG